jgi:ubiquinone biosynthesis protein Coq4
MYRGLSGAYDVEEQWRQFETRYSFSAVVLHVSDTCLHARRCGLDAEFIMSVYYERHFEMPIDELRQRLRITTAPK